MKRLAIRRYLAWFFAAGLLLGGGLGYEYSRLPDVSVLKKENPRTTALIELRERESRSEGSAPRRHQTWMRYRTISEHLKKAVVVGEDTTFFSHQGIDFFELRQTIEDSWREGKVDRGASTITMQLARNLYLSPERSLLRKLREMIITLQLERSLSKQRILELYLNVVEWGRGIYGAEAAARHYFLKSAADLTPVEAATLAALLPNPLRSRQRALVRRRNRILERMVAIGHITADEFAVARDTPLFYVEEPGPERGG